MSTAGAMKAPPQAKAKATPEPEIRPAFYRYVGGPPPPVGTQEAIGLLAKARGGAAADELDGAIRVLDEELESARGRLGIASEVKAVVGLIGDLVARRAVYTARRKALRETLGLKPTPDAAPPLVPGMAMTLGTTEGRQADISKHLANQASMTKDELDRIDRELTSVASLGADDFHFTAMARESPRSQAELRAEVEGHLAEVSRLNDLIGGRTPSHATQVWPQDVLLSRFTALTDRRRELAGKHAALVGDRDQATNLVKARVQSAVDAAGGKDAVATMLTSAMALSTPQAENPAVGELAGVKDDLSRLEASGVVDGPAYAALRARHDGLTKTLADARAASAARMQATAKTLVDGAMSGDEAARAQIEGLTQRVPSAFPPAFASAVAASRFDLAALEEIGRALQAK